MKKSILFFAALALASLLYGLTRPADIPFQKRQIDLGASETAALADINGDGKLDIVSGENWYESPGWKRHHFRQIPYMNGYVDNFSDLPLDVDGDGRPDIVSCSWFQRSLRWWKNPGSRGGEVEWTAQPIQEGFPIEFAFLVDLDNDGKAREVLPQFGDTHAPLSWYEVQKGKFVRHIVSSSSYGHGIGAGDVNRDGRNDIITPKGWFEAPANPRTGQWAWHAEYDLGTSAGFIYAYDINGDGRNDLITTSAHDYGFFWLEQAADHRWTKHMIDETWSQGHAMTMIDLDGDGRPDFLTGKRYMAHDTDPGAREPLGVYWYQFLKGDDGKVVWVKHVIDYSTRTGGGMQIPVAAHLGFVTAGKSGLFLFENPTLRLGRSSPR
jgi:hypothetical protein